MCGQDVPTPQEGARRAPPAGPARHQVPLAKVTAALGGAKVRSPPTSSREAPASAGTRGPERGAGCRVPGPRVRPASGARKGTALSGPQGARGARAEAGGSGRCPAPSARGKKRSRGPGRAAPGKGLREGPPTPRAPARVSPATRRGRQAQRPPRRAAAQARLGAPARRPAPREAAGSHAGSSDEQPPPGRAAQGGGGGGGAQKPGAPRGGHRRRAAHDRRRHGRAAGPREAVSAGVAGAAGPASWAGTADASPSGAYKPARRAPLPRRRPRLWGGARPSRLGAAF